MSPPAATQPAAPLWTAPAGGENNADNVKDKPPSIYVVTTKL